MNILIDARPVVDPQGSGVTRVAKHAIASLIQQSPEHCFFLATTGTRKPTLSLHGLHATAIHRVIPNKLWSAVCTARILSFDRLFRAQKPDFLLLPNIGFVGQPHIPYGVIVHDLSFLIEPSWYSRKTQLWHAAVHAKKLLTRACVLFAVSERTKQDLAHWLNIPLARIFTIPLGKTWNEEEVPTRPNAFPSGRFVLCLDAGYHARKNAAAVVVAVDALRQETTFNDVRCVLVCQCRPSDPYFERSYVFPLVRPSDAELAWLYQQACACVYPSWYEGFGLPLHEAARFGTPCIASTTGALPETAPAGTIFVPPTKPHLLAEAIRAACAHHELFQTRTSIDGWEETGRILKEQIQKSSR